MSGWRDAFDAQMGLWRWLRSDAGQAILRLKYERNMDDHFDPELRQFLGRMYASEESRLLGADPIFVSAEMCDLIAAAASPDLDEPFVPEPLFATDLPTGYGFLLYERPFEILNRFEEPVSIKALSWQPLVSPSDDLDLEADPEAVMSQWTKPMDETGDMADKGFGGIALSIYDDRQPGFYNPGVAVPPVELMHLTPWWFGMTFDGNETDAVGERTGADWWWRVVQVTFRLMQQQIAAKGHVRGERSQRREAKRLDFPERETLVVRLRRERHAPTEDEHGPANYSHRFIVSGHWRNQWYPASNEHRQIWISPYVKGDESLPLVVRPRRAFVLNR